MAVCVEVMYVHVHIQFVCMYIRPSMAVYIRLCVEVRYVYVYI